MPKLWRTLAGLTLAASATVAGAQYPEKPVVLVVPFALLLSRSR